MTFQHTFPRRSKGGGKGGFDIGDDEHSGAHSWCDEACLLRSPSSSAVGGRQHPFARRTHPPPHQQDRGRLHPRPRPFHLGVAAARCQDPEWMRGNNSCAAPVVFSPLPGCFVCGYFQCIQHGPSHGCTPSCSHAISPLPLRGWTALSVREYPLHWLGQCYLQSHSQRQGVQQADHFVWSSSLWQSTLSSWCRVTEVSHPGGIDHCSFFLDDVFVLTLLCAASSPPSLTGSTASLEINLRARGAPGTGTLVSSCLALLLVPPGGARNCWLDGSARPVGCCRPPAASPNLTELSACSVLARVGPKSFTPVARSSWISNTLVSALPTRIFVRR